MKQPQNITFDKCLRAIIGGREKATRYRIFRAFWRAQLLAMKQARFRGAKVASLTPQEDTTDQVFADFKANGVAPEWVSNLSTAIPQWRRARQQAQNRANAAKRWRKPRPNITLLREVLKARGVID